MAHPTAASISMPAASPSCHAASSCPTTGRSSITSTTISKHHRHITHREGNSAFIPGGIIAREHFFTVPLEWTKAETTNEHHHPSDLKYIEIFVREVR